MQFPLNCMGRPAAKLVKGTTWCICEDLKHGTKGLQLN
jgi:hypothetical protein